MIELDLISVSKRLKEKSGLQIRKVDRICIEYKRFLHLLAAGHEVTPPALVDDFWHLHILDTEKYASDCDKLGGFIHHIIVDEEEGEFDNTLVIYEKTFKEKPPKSIWR
jgi:hypothetical protein